MRNTRIYLLLIIIIAFLSASAIYFFGQSQKYKHEYSLSLKKTASQEALVAVRRGILSADSLLFKGDFKSALNAYKMQLKQLPDSLRIGVEDRIRMLNKIKSTQQSGLLEQGDSISNDVGNDGQDLGLVDMSAKRFDSLNFALSKANLKVKNLKRQLAEKSAGEYLTFKSGKGSQVHYVGEVKKGMANGIGLALLETGSRYEGEWKNNLRHGEGAFYWPDGEFYVGGYQNDKRHGQGKYVWPNGEKYVGEWKDDKRNGKGTFYDKEGEIITNGTWKQDELIESVKN